MKMFLHRSYGTATLDGANVGAGVAVTAVVEGALVGSATTTTGGNYILIITQPQGKFCTDSSIPLWWGDRISMGYLASGCCDQSEPDRGQWGTRRLHEPIHDPSTANPKHPDLP